MNDEAEPPQADASESNGEQHRHHHRRRRRHMRYAERRHWRDVLTKIAISVTLIAAVMVLWWWLVSGQSQ